MKRLNSGRVWLGVLVVVALGVAAGGIAYAAIPGSGGVIHGCYKTQNGQLRVVDAGGCGPSETALDWNQQGLGGPQGEPGSPGSPGADGQNVTGTALPAGDSHCPNGGSSFTAANGTFYACNGSAGGGGGGFGTSYQTVAFNQVPFGFEGNDVISLTIPNGAPLADYLVTARVGVQLTGPAGFGQSTMATCVLFQGNTLLDEDIVSVSLPKAVMVPGDPPVPGVVAGNQASSMTLVGIAGLQAGSVVHVRCDGIVLNGSSLTGTAKVAIVKAG